MGWFTGFVVYFLVWWTVLFAVLPIGVQPATGQDVAGGWQGPPKQPRLLYKAAVTTVVSVVLWFGIYLLVQSDWLSFRSGWLAMPD